MSQEPQHQAFCAGDHLASEVLVVAIDGPAGSGKSTVAKRLAQRLGLEYLDTGAMYRSVAFAVMARGIDLVDAEAVVEVAKNSVIDIQDSTVTVDGVDATTQIRGPEVTRSVSTVAAIPGVRDVLRVRQRAWVIERGGGVLEGRDIGTAVFPEAQLKVYLSASSQVRAARRAGEVSALDYETVAADLAARDAADTTRQHDPLTQAPDALHLDTTDISIEEVVETLVARLS
ncbi:MAG: (d)CMP kinase [Acidimicrobiia bacterium]|nr:(d)CMP kinase [Acidimicrobiia bacterium]MYC58437.1 (d)CMP kinase [Acidimicrobiia bacterium]MYI30457.1 (d)CMP kinase [Acidimicrobiia bacterium]